MYRLQDEKLSYPEKQAQYNRENRAKETLQQMRKSYTAQRSKVGGICGISRIIEIGGIGKIDPNLGSVVQR
jgi:hypothetical protein